MIFLVTIFWDLEIKPIYEQNRILDLLRHEERVSKNKIGFLSERERTVGTGKP
jgi:hypothetical protein